MVKFLTTGHQESDVLRIDGLMSGDKELDRLIALDQLLCQDLGSVAGLLMQFFHVFIIFVFFFLILIEEKLVGEVVLR